MQITISKNFEHPVVSDISTPSNPVLKYSAATKYQKFLSEIWIWMEREFEW